MAKLVIDFMTEGGSIAEKYPPEEWRRCGDFYQIECGPGKEPSEVTQRVAARHGATHLVWEGGGWWLALRSASDC